MSLLMTVTALEMMMNQVLRGCRLTETGMIFPLGSELADLFHGSFIKPDDGSAFSTGKINAAGRPLLTRTGPRIH